MGFLIEYPSFDRSKDPQSVEDYNEFCKYFNGKDPNTPRFFELDAAESATQEWLDKIIIMLRSRETHRIINGQESTERFRIACGYTECDRATCASSNGVDFISLGIRLILNIRTYFYALFSDEEFLLRIGIPETVNLFKFKNPLVAEEIMDNYAVPPPADKDICKICDLFTWSAIMHIFEHEFCHILEGHLSYKNDLLKNQKKPRCLDTHAMEWDAEFTAAMKTMQSSLMMNRPNLNLSEIENYEFTRYIRYYVVTFSIYSVLRMNCNKISGKLIYGKSHATTQTKLIHIMNEFIAYSERIGYNGQNVTSSCSQAINDAEYFYLKCYGENSSTIQIDIDKSGRYIDLIENRRQKLIPFLKKYRKSKEDRKVAPSLPIISA